MSLLAALIPLALMGGENYGFDGKPHVYLETEEELKAKRKAAQEKNNISNGLKKFNIQGVEIWAINEKNAIRKFNKL